MYAGAKTGAGYSLCHGRTDHRRHRGGQDPVEMPVEPVPRFYDAASGQVAVDGTDVKEYSLDELRDKTGVVPQKSVLFKERCGTICAGKTRTRRMKSTGLWIRPRPGVYSQIQGRGAGSLH